MMRVFTEDVSEQTIANLFPNYYTQSMLFHINKHEVYLIENQKQRGKNIKMIKIYIQPTLSNIVKTGSEQIQQMFFSFFFD